MKQRSVRPGEQTAVFDPSTAKWLIETVQRLAEKLDNATGFAENGPRTLAAHPPQKRGTNYVTPAKPTIRIAQIQSTGNNHLSVRFVDDTGSPTGAIFDVAKPSKLRHTASNYSDVSSITTMGAQSIRVTYTGGAQEVWVVTPNYRTLDLIHIAEVGYTGVTVSGEDLTWIDLNIDARAWATST